MANGCGVIPATATFTIDVLGFVDCEARSFGIDGYLALIAPGSAGAMLVSTCLTLLVALVGYRLLLGEVPTLREGVLTLVKIGAVLALTTGWPAFQTLIYDTTIHGPAEIISDLQAGDAVADRSDALAARLNRTDRAFQRLTIAGVGTVASSSRGAGGAIGAAVEVGSDDGAAPALFGGFDAFALGTGRAAFLGGAIGAVSVVRLSAGLLLAFAPLFIAFLLFDTTRALFEGWVRGLLATVLSSTAIIVAVDIALRLFNPWLTSLIDRRAAGLTIVGAPIQLLTMALIFDALAVALLILSTRVAFTCPLPRARVRLVPPASPLPHSLASQGYSAAASASLPAGERSRAAAIVDAVRASERREGLASADGLTRASSGAGANAGIRPNAAKAETILVEGSDPLRRRTVNRISAGAGRRDRSA